MAKPIQHYEYLAQERIGSLHQQIHKNRLLGIPIQLSFNVPFFGFTIGKPTKTEQSLPEQLQAVVAYLHKHQPDDIGTVDMPRKYIAGILPMFAHFVPQGFGVKPTDKPEFVYYGGSTDTTIIGLAGPAANVVGRAATATGDMGMISSALPDLTRVLAQEFRVQSRYGKTGGRRRRSDESQALDCIGYMEIYNRQGTQLRHYSFIATLKLDSEKMAGRLRADKRIILASPLYTAFAE